MSTERTCAFVSYRLAAFDRGISEGRVVPRLGLVVFDHRLEYNAEAVTKASTGRQGEFLAQELQ
jgi:hypothetical protein